jgi:hypothetical protein
MTRPLDRLMTAHRGVWQDRLRCRRFVTTADFLATLSGSPRFAPARQSRVMLGSSRSESWAFDAMGSQWFTVRPDPLLASWDGVTVPSHMASGAVVASPSIPGADPPDLSRRSVLWGDLP